MTAELILRILAPCLMIGGVLVGGVIGNRFAPLPGDDPREVEPEHIDMLPWRP